MREDSRIDLAMGFPWRFLLALKGSKREEFLAAKEHNKRKEKWVWI